LSAEVLETRLIEIHRTARTSFEEGGSNSLYLAIGFVSWTSQGKNQLCKAPLLLAPVAFSASAISSINKSLDEALRAFGERRLSEPFPYLILDARYEKVREAGVILSQAVLIAVAVDSDGQRQILGVDLANRESRTSWRDFLLALKERGLFGAAMCTSCGTRSTICRASWPTTACRSCAGSMTGDADRERIVDQPDARKGVPVTKADDRVEARLFETASKQQGQIEAGAEPAFQYRARRPHLLPVLFEALRGQCIDDALV
jgi:hypothetical protein